MLPVRDGRTNVDLDRARTLLTTELAELDERERFAQSSLAEASADMVGEEGALGQHPADYGSEVNTTMEAELNVDTIAEQRRRLIDAVERIDTGTYGRCAVCHRQIDEERLEARPEAATCREHADTPVVT
jgi:RNA polymerase-binding transcription factor DksA